MFAQNATKNILHVHVVPWRKNYLFTPDFTHVIEGENVLKVILIVLKKKKKTGGQGWNSVLVDPVTVI